MKRSVMMGLLLGCCSALWAQIDDPNKTTSEESSIKTTTNYNAYGMTTIRPPLAVESNFSRDYPMASNAIWTNWGDYYRVTYNDQGRYSHVYYAPNGVSWNSFLPVHQTWVPEDVAMQAATLFGPDIYSIHRLKPVDGMEIYQVTLLDDGVSRTEWMATDGTRMEMSHIYRINSAGNVPMDETKWKEGETKIKTEKDGDYKIKMKAEDGTEIKIKKDGDEIKIKRDDD
jgi:hypothetical protein